MSMRAGIRAATFRITTLSVETSVYTDRCPWTGPSVERRFGMDGRGADLMKLKLSDWVANKVVDHGIRHVFMITGGGAMHLNHSFASHQGLACIFNHHEQACAIAAESYYRLSNRLALVNVTCGPGGTNAVTGVYGAHVDSLGMIVN